MGTLVDKGFFEFLEELQGKLVLLIKGLLTHDSLHRSCISSNSIFGILIYYVFSEYDEYLWVSRKRQ